VLNITIDGIETRSEKGERILTAAARVGVVIPTLCQHEALPDLGSCRLCIVEVIEGGRRKVVASCVYPIQQDCAVLTDTERVRADRRVIISMLHDRAPHDPYLCGLCAAYGVPLESRYELPPELTCVLCGRCVAACDAMGSGAIDMAGRGTGKRVSTPYDESAESCIGCGACAAVCPVQAVPMREDGGARTVWNTRFEPARCASCGASYGTAAALDFIRRRLDPNLQALLSLCPRCRRLRPAGGGRHKSVPHRASK
jgi:NADH dehydrogenase/NADH:ubiquinone oxidoreductase subunit G